MAYPPRSRRTKIRRRATFAGAVLAILIVAAGFSFLGGERFDARSAPLAGTPVTLSVERGVVPAALAPVRAGITAADAYSRRMLGRPVRGDVEARIAGRTGCRLLSHTDGIPVGEADRGRLCIDTASLRWSWLVDTDTAAAEVIAAHEYAHVVQADLGCLPGGSEEPRWLVEGMASDLAWRALIGVSRATWDGLRRSIAEGGAFDVNLSPLERYETAGGGDAEYALWHGAVEALPGAAGRLMSWCRRVGTGEPWRLAFRRTFGLTSARFYERFERARLDGMISRRLILTQEEIGA